MNRVSRISSRPSHVQERLIAHAHPRRPRHERHHYDDHYATLMDGIRYATGGGPQTPELAAEEALTRLESDFPSLHFANGIDRTKLRAVIVAAIEREKSGELSDDEAVHVALDDLRDLGVPIGPRPPDDPHPDLGNELLNSRSVLKDGE